jgi:hypothetical protein
MWEPPVPVQVCFDKITWRRGYYFESARVCTTSGEGLRIHATLSKGLCEPLQKVRRGFFFV